VHISYICLNKTLGSLVNMLAYINYLYIKILFLYYMYMYALMFTLKCTCNINATAECFMHLDVLQKSATFLQVVQYVT